MLKKLVTVLCSVTLIFNVFAAQVDAAEPISATASGQVNESGEYAYPLTPDMEEWRSLSNSQEMWDATQIPQDILNKIPTDKLILLIEEYPLLGDIRVFDTLEQGYEIVKSRFNGREAVYSVL